MMETYITKHQLSAESKRIIKSLEGDVYAARNDTELKQLYKTVRLITGKTKPLRVELKKQHLTYEPNFYEVLDAKTTTAPVDTIAFFSSCFCYTTATADEFIGCSAHELQYGSIYQAVAQPELSELNEPMMCCYSNADLRLLINPKLMQDTTLQQLNKNIVWHLRQKILPSYVTAIDTRTTAYSFNELTAFSARRYHPATSNWSFKSSAK
jgi:hypothetical protein